MPRLKERFQVALQQTPELRPLFNLQLDDKIRAFKQLVQTAEDTFWAMARAEFEQSGGRVSTAPHVGAQGLCEKAATLGNQILSRLHTVCNAGGTAGIMGTGNKTLYAPFVGQTCDTLLAWTETMREMLMSCHDKETYNDRRDSFEEIYDWAAAIFALWGPHFPDVLTSYFTGETDTAEYYLPSISVATASAGEHIVLTNVNGTPTSQNWRDVGKADTKIYIPRMEGLDDVYDAALVGQTGLSLAVDTDLGATALTIKKDTGILLDTEDIPTVTLSKATTFGEGFEIRILEKVTV